MPDNDLLTATQAGAILGISGRTLNRMADRDEVPVAHRLPGVNGPRLYRHADIEALKPESVAS